MVNADLSQKKAEPENGGRVFAMAGSTMTLAEILQSIHALEGQLRPPFGSGIFDRYGSITKLTHDFQTVIDGPGFNDLPTSDAIKGGSCKAKWFARWAGSYKIASVGAGSSPPRVS
jgi:hypothetical protein